MHRLTRHAALHLLDATFAPPVLACCWLALTHPAFAYVDPSVMTYTIQALAGVAVALSAVLGVVWRRARRWLLRAMHVDENAGKAVEPAVHAVDANDTEAHTAADAATRKLTEPRKPFAPALPWRARLALALIAALCVSTLLQEVVLNGNLPAADGTPVDWTIYDKVNLKSALAWLAVVAAFIALARLRPLASRAASVAACLLIVIAQSMDLDMLGAQYTDTLARPVVTEEGLTTVSPKSNVIVFVLDMFDTKRCS